MKRLIVTIAPPTPNGDLHLGHIAGPYMAADIYARVQRQKGHDVLFVSYSDDYQSYLHRKGRELDVEPFALGLRNGQMIHETLGMLDIRPDWWMQSGHNPHFRDAVRMFYEGAVARGAIGTRKHAMAYFPAFGVWGYEAYARGACNYCGAPSDASQCENCAHSPEINKMEGLHCTLGASPLEWHEVERDYLKVGMYREFLRELYGRHPLRPNLRAFIDEVLALPDEDLDWYTTRPHECGVTIPAPGTAGGDDRIVHTWFSGVAGYYAASREYMASRGDAALADAYWKDPSTRIVHFLGLDCSFSHGIVYPSLLSNLDGFTTDVLLLTNCFLKLDGQDFSTSRGIAVWARELAAEAPVDAIRLYLASVAPEVQIEDYRQGEFDAWLANVYHGLIPALARAAEGEQAGAGNGSGAALDDETTAALGEARAAWRTATDLDTFSMQAIARISLKLLEMAGSRLSAGRPVAPLVMGAAAMMAAVAPTLSSRLAEAARFDRAATDRWLLDPASGFSDVPRSLAEARA